MAYQFFLLVFFWASVHDSMDVGANWDRTLQPAPRSEWVRTRDGWEETSHWGQHLPQPPVLHPFVVAGFQLSGSIFALLAFSPEHKD